MKRFLVMLMVALFSAVLILPDAEARRMGGGRSVGKQTDMPKRAAPNQAAPAQGAAAGAAAAGGRSWMGPLAGIAAGLGLAALASWMGFGEEFATMMMLMLVAMVAFIAFRMFMARRQGGSLAGAGAGGAAGPAAGRPFDQAMQRQSLAPSAGSNGAASGAGAAAGAASAAAAASLIPADFDADGFVRNAKVFFVRLQAAFDKKDLDDLREFTSPEMFGELKVEILQRGDEPQTTDVVKLDGRLIGVDRDLALELASVQFSGMMRESADGAAEAFEEIWNFSRPVNGGAGWVLAGIQQVR